MVLIFCCCHCCSYSFFFLFSPAFCSYCSLSCCSSSCCSLRVGFLLERQEMNKREKANFRIANQLVPGTKVRAIYADEDNDPSWYDAVINSVEVTKIPPSDILCVFFCLSFHHSLLGAEIVTCDAAFAIRESFRFLINARYVLSHTV